jgi:hypothetical protein
MGDAEVKESRGGEDELEEVEVVPPRFVLFYLFFF